jgi:D-lyxose ketol-isomerase
MKRNEVAAARAKASEMLSQAGIVLSDDERANIEVADLNLGEFDTTGLCLITYVNTERVCAKELIMFPRQTCPQHLHPPVDGKPGKEETFRCRWGEVYLYVEGEPTPNPQAQPPAHRVGTYTVWHEIVLKPGEQYTLYPETWHWFQAGDEGAIISEFSTKSTDENDLFTDEAIRREPIVED